MRILILSPDLPSHGVVQSLAAQGVEPVVALASGESRTHGVIRYERIASRGDHGDPLHLRWSKKALRTFVRDLRPDLIHVVGDPWIPTAESGAAVARHLKIPYVVVGQSSVGGPNGLTARWQSKRVRDGAAGLGGVSRVALQHLVGDAPSVPTVVLPNPGFEIPLSTIDRPVPAFPTFLVVGRIVPERGLDLLFDSLATCFGEWRLRIVGTGPAQVQLEAHAQRLGLSSRIEWLGGLPRSELARLWPEVDLIVAPSRSTPTWVEPTGSVVMEAMAHGVGAVVTRCGALPDIVGEGGMIVDEDDGEALSRALSGVIGDPSRVVALGATARRRLLEQFGDGPLAGRMLAWWREARAESVG